MMHARKFSRKANGHQFLGGICFVRFASAICESVRRIRWGAGLADSSVGGHALRPGEEVFENLCSLCLTAKEVLCVPQEPVAQTGIGHIALECASPCFKLLWLRPGGTVPEASKRYELLDTPLASTPTDLLISTRCGNVEKRNSEEVLACLQRGEGYGQIRMANQMHVKRTSLTKQRPGVDRVVGPDQKKERCCSFDVQRGDCVDPEAARGNYAKVSIRGNVHAPQRFA